MKNPTKYPLVSIGIPTYNRNSGICKTLVSVWQQNYPNLEVIVSDNCSTDNTRSIVQSIGMRHAEIKYYRQENNIGMIKNFEFVLRKATGKYFMWLADDDELEAGVIAKYVEFLEGHTDYAIASGKIKYWQDEKPDVSEQGFTFEQKSSGLRVLGYYSKVIYGGMIHGLIRRELTKNISLRQVVGNDYHFIANLAYLGEIKHFEFVGYHKSFGGTSKTFKQYAKQIGDSNFAGQFPHLKIACDAFAEVMYRSSVYSAMPLPAKITLAASSFSGIMIHYYGGIFPFVVGGKVKRFILNHMAPKTKSLR